MPGPIISMPPAMSEMFDVDANGRILGLRPAYAGFFASLANTAQASSRYGASSERPTSTMPGRYVGMPYFDTTFGQPFWLQSPSTDAWVTYGGSSSGSGSVTSVGVSTVADLTVSTAGSPVSTSGTITITAVDAGVDQLVGWDDSASTKRYFDLGAGLSITSTTINYSGVFSTALSSSFSYNPVQAVPGIAGEGEAGGAIVYLKTDAKWYLAKADSTTTAGPVLLGANLISSAANGSTTIMLFGEIRADAVYTSTLPIGGAIYLSAATAGAITTTAPTTTAHVIRVLGHTNSSAAGIFFRPSPDWMTHT